MLSSVLPLLLNAALGAGTNCSSYALSHSGCAPKNASKIQCATVTETHNSTRRSAPPWGLRFAYDSGGRTITQRPFTTEAACAFGCSEEAACRGFAVVNADTRGVRNC